MQNINRKFLNLILLILSSYFLSEIIISSFFNVSNKKNNFQLEKSINLNYGNIKQSDFNIKVWKKLFDVIDKKKTKKLTKKQLHIVKIESFDFKNYSLKGCIVGNEQNSLAFIYSKNIRKNLVKKINEYIENYKIIKIKRFEIILKDKDGKLYRLINKSINQKNEKSSNQILDNKISENKNFYFTRDEINNFLYNNLNKILQTTNIVPYFVKGKMIGIKINRLSRNNILYKKFGVLKGDVILSINEKKIDNMQKGIKMWENLKDSNYINLLIMRNNKKIKFFINVR